MDYQSSPGSISFSKPRAWSTYQFRGNSLKDYSLTPDGKRFAIIVPEEGAELRRSNQVVFLQSFTTELRRIMAK